MKTTFVFWSIALTGAIKRLLLFPELIWCKFSIKLKSFKININRKSKFNYWLKVCYEKESSEDFQKDFLWKNYWDNKTDAEVLSESMAHFCEKPQKEFHWVLHK